VFLRNVTFRQADAKEHPYSLEPILADVEAPAAPAAR
jgi:hypothetical protein